MKRGTWAKIRSNPLANRSTPAEISSVYRQGLAKIHRATETTEELTATACIVVLNTTMSIKLEPRTAVAKVWVRRPDHPRFPHHLCRTRSS